jgi:hypothetical protein
LVRKPLPNLALGGPPISIVFDITKLVNVKGYEKKKSN